MLQVIYWTIRFWEFGSEENKMVGYFFPLLQHREAFLGIRTISKAIKKNYHSSDQADLVTSTRSQLRRNNIFFWRLSFDPDTWGRKEQKGESEFEEMAVANNFDYKK